ncbi:hypothetical protein Q4534_12315 [Cyclobacterium sp. 1_MG-2023]|uniref:hypothetical protein n=1 Tax=Cyclobacterium sp. 1_MG-2023 TaxID=3062681 RepID=UPI0026E3B0F6|nr:hypothetical protein [Cyclobacterium sp. 1_MG-2023]MDO6438199.1 hypothetical protein [Cyclobacterium sp. 1_MG-2023]
METFLKYLKAEAIGGHIIRISLACLLLFGGFTKLILIGALEYNLFWSIILAAIETFAAFGLLIHYKKPIIGIAAGVLAVLSIFLRVVFSIGWVRDHILQSHSFLDAFGAILGVYNNGLFHIALLFGAGIYCLGNSYKAYIKERITKPWPH